jgi:uncharacterized membrane protein YuzA (DUF378 family)
VASVQNIYRRCTKVKVLNITAATLVIIGALNWGLVAIAKFDLVAELFGLEFGETNAATRVVYALVGLAGVYSIGALVAARGRVLTESGSVASASR